MSRLTSTGPLTRFSLYVVIALLVALGAYASLASPSLSHFGFMALVLLASAFLSLLIGHLAYRLSWLERSPRILWTLLAGYALVGVLTLLGVLAAALLMFINTEDVQLVAILMLFGVGAAISFGYLLAGGFPGMRDCLSRLRTRWPREGSTHASSPAVGTRWRILPGPSTR